MNSPMLRTSSQNVTVPLGCKIEMMIVHLCASCYLELMNTYSSHLWVLEAGVGIPHLSVWKPILHCYRIAYSPPLLHFPHHTEVSEPQFVLENHARGH